MIIRLTERKLCRPLLLGLLALVLLAAEIGLHTDSQMRQK